MTNWFNYVELFSKNKLELLNFLRFNQKYFLLQKLKNNLNNKFQLDKMIKISKKYYRFFRIKMLLKN